MNNITIIIPIYNEGQNIKLLLSKIIKKYFWIYILIINDGSTDEIINIIKNNQYKNLKLLSNNINKWLTYSIIRGIINCETDFFIIMDWDNQHPVKNISNFIDLFTKWNTIVIWNRKNIEFDIKKYRKYISYVWNFLINLKLKRKWIKLSDPLTWFFWWKTIFFQRTIISNRNFFSNRWYKFLFEFLLKIDWKKDKISSFLFEFWKRDFWKSKLWIRECFIFIKWLTK
jgi:hypothetical protein